MGSIYSRYYKSWSFFKFRHPTIPLPGAGGQKILLWVGIYRDWIFDFGITTWFEAETLGWAVKIKLLKFELGFMVRLLKLK